MKIEKKHFGKVKEGLDADLFTMTNDNMISVTITNYGGRITEIKVPDKKGKTSNIVLGFDNIEDYIKDNPYFGSIVGRYANRISNGKLSIDGSEYQLNINEGINHLHGGIIGFDKVIWKARELKDEKEVGLELYYLSKDSEEGYPGNLQVKVIYSLSKNNELSIKYFARSDKPTVCNLTNHTYFNLKDGGESSILDHSMQIFANQYIPIDSSFIPLGTIAKVNCTPFDFREQKKIGDRINDEHIQLKNGIGYDHCFVLSDYSKPLNRCAKVYEETSRRMLECYTEEPSVQFYCGNFLDGSLSGKNNVVYNYRNGFCLETGHFPDSPNQPEWPSTQLNPGEVYNSLTVYKFSVFDSDK